MDTGAIIKKVGEAANRQLPTDWSFLDGVQLAKRFVRFSSAHRAALVGTSVSYARMLEVLRQAVESRRSR